MKEHKKKSWVQILLGAGLFALVCVYMIQAIYDEVTLFKDTNTVCHNTNGLVGLGLLRGCLRGLTLRASSIEEMNDEPKSELSSFNIMHQTEYNP